MTKQFPLTVYSWQVTQVGHAVSFVNNKYSPRMQVAFSLADAEFDTAKVSNPDIFSTTDIIIHFIDENSLFELGAEFGRRSFANAVTGIDDTSKMQSCLPLQKK